MSHFAKIREQLDARELDAMLVTSGAGEFYAAGFRGEGVALITKKGTWYYTDSRYIEVAEKTLQDAVVSMRPPQYKTYQECVAALAAEHGIAKLGFEDESMSVASYKKWTDAVKAEFVPATSLLTELRAVKDEQELAAMKEAQRVTDAAFTEILNDLKPGVKECEIAAKLTYLMACMGAERNSFDPIVASGPNGSMPHAVPSQREIQKGEFVTMDFGCVYDGYCSDMTRTVAVGQPNDEMVLVYNTVLEAQKAGIAMAKAGVIGKDVHNAAADVIAAAGYGEYFGHGFGHSLGVEIHENPGFNSRCDKPIPAGATISCEPGIYLPGKFGVRIEDVVMLTEGGNIDLTHSPKHLIIL